MNILQKWIFTFSGIHEPFKTISLNSWYIYVKGGCTIFEVEHRKNYKLKLKFVKPVKISARIVKPKEFDIYKRENLEIFLSLLLRVLSWGGGGRSFGILDLKIFRDFPSSILISLVIASSDSNVCYYTCFYILIWFIGWS